MGSVEMDKIAILVDSGCQIKIGSMEEQGIFVVPLTVTIDNKTYLDELEITQEEVFRILDKTDSLIKTSQPPLGETEKTVKRIKELGYDKILALPIATGLSNTLNSFVLACNNVGIPVEYVDTKGTCANQKYLAILAGKLIKEKAINEVKTILEKLIDRSATVIMVPNLNHLAKSGRITTAVAKLANLFKIVPVMKLNYDLGGRIDNLYTVRTIKKANIKIIDYLIEKLKVNNIDFQITIAHVLAKNMAEEMKQVMIDKIGSCNNIKIIELPTVVGAHMGKGGIGYQVIPFYK